MKQVVLFNHEEDVNQWLCDNSDKRIIDIKLAHASTENTSELRILIIYEVKKKCL